MSLPRGGVDPYSVGKKEAERLWVKESRVGSGGRAGGIERLHPAMRSHMWKPGESGNPSGHGGEYGMAIKLAQRAAPKAVRRLIKLIDSADERVAAVACNSILDRAFGKPKVAEEEKDDYVARIEAMTPEERLGEARRILEKIQYQAQQRGTGAKSRARGPRLLPSEHEER